jgi:hypothetical protein
MLEDPVKRETVKGVGTVLAASAGGPVAATLAVTLGVAVEALSIFSTKRTNELFNNEQVVAVITDKIKKSDDFAGFVLSVWQKHNLESDNQRRKLLKQLLEVESFKKTNEFENFSKLENIIQNINVKAVWLLGVIHSDVVQKRTIDSSDAASKLLTLSTLIELTQTVEAIHEQDIEYFVNELGSYGLLNISHGRWNGPILNETSLGYLFVSYIDES